MTERRRIPLAIAVVFLALAVVLAGQSLADATAPEVPNAALTGQAVGRVGFAYLTGLRVFVADLLWDRIDPLADTYYRKNWGLAHDTFMLPSVKVITMLDPQFIEAYYVTPDVLIESSRLSGVAPRDARSRFQAGVDLAKEGVVNNPKSGVLLASYAQILFTDAKDLKAAARTRRTSRRRSRSPCEPWPKTSCGARMRRSGTRWPSRLASSRGRACRQKRPPPRRSRPPSTTTRTRPWTSRDRELQEVGVHGRMPSAARMSILAPDAYVTSVHSINLAALKRDRIRVLLLDPDNTLLPRESPRVWRRLTSAGACHSRALHAEDALKQPESG